MCLIVFKPDSTQYAKRRQVFGRVCVYVCERVLMCARMRVRVLRCMRVCTSASRCSRAHVRVTTTIFKSCPNCMPGVRKRVCVRVRAGAHVRAHACNAQHFKHAQTVRFDSSYAVWATGSAH